VSSDPNTPSPHTLDYHDVPKRRGVVLRPVVRIAIFVSAISLALMVAWFYGMPEVVRVIDCRRLIESPPPGTIIYSNSPAVINRIAGNADYWYSEIPTAFRKGTDLLDAQRPWHSWTSDSIPLGVLQCPGGNKRLIIATPWREWSEAGPSFPECEVHPLPTAGVTSFGPRRIGRLLPIPYRSGVTIYAGRVDSSDPSHLIVDYDIDGQKGIIDGWLKPDDTLSFSIRSGPATTRPSEGFTAPPHSLTP
jgi:hypothetical protein